ncbi:MAG TPA: hypothetical protein VFC47_05200, partial [Caulobacteraceae bacterium]|nr:hypothetical protein [Caulobacteraceae bacterium]
DVFSDIQNIAGSNLNDVLEGNAGVNTITTGSGNATIVATEGADTYRGGAGFDTVDYSQGGFASVYANLAAATATYYATDGTSAAQSLTAISRVIGTTGTDTLIAAASGSTLDGAGGNDILEGGGGADTFVFNHGYAGATTIYAASDTSATLRLGGGLTADSLWASSNGTTLTIGERGGGSVVISGDFKTTGGIQSDAIKTLDMGGAGQLDVSQISYVVTGSDNADTISGPATTSNLILGYNGVDVINASGGLWTQNGSVIDGGQGNDVITTSAGDDQFLFDRGDGQDTITDAGGINTIVFGPTVKASDVIYQIVGNDLYVGLSDPANPTFTASQVGDSMRLVGAGVQYVDRQSNAISYPTSFIVQAGGTTVDLTKLNLNWTVVKQGGGGGPNKPIILDLNGDGLEITPVATSDIVTQDPSGVISRMSWVGPTDGILAVDRAGDGNINTTADISFVQDEAGATTDLGGLAGWDTNGDGVIDKNDANFGKLLIWVDKNQDGRAEAGEVMTLAQAGIASISLAGTATGFTGADTVDSVVYNTTTFTRTDGTVGTAYDAALAEQFLSGPDGSVAPPSLDNGVNSVIGQLTSDPAAVVDAAIARGAPLTQAQVDRLVHADFSQQGGVMSAQDHKLWNYLLDPKAKWNLSQSGGGQFLAEIRSTSAFAAPAAASPAPAAPAPAPVAPHRGISTPLLAGAAAPMLTAGAAIATAPLSARDGPAELATAAPAAPAAALGPTLAAWLADGDASGSGLSGGLAQLASQSLAPSLAAGQGARTPDAATAQRLALLKQSLASQGEGRGAFAAIWAHKGQTDGMASLAAAVATAPKFAQARAA